jgi:protein O-mannosyl-transferase
LAKVRRAFILRAFAMETTSAHRPPRSLPGWAGALFCLGAVVALFSPVFHFGFIWDDDMHLTENPCITGALGLRGIWTTSAARYFPLVSTTFWLEHAAWGLSPLPYHVVNVLVHGCCAVVLWRVLLRLRVPGAWLGALAWAIHPVQVESVAWVTELKNTQSGLFFLLSILFYCRWLEPGKGRRSDYAACLGFAALAMASKSSTVVLPAVLALCAWWLRPPFRPRDILALVPVGVFSAAASALSLWTQGLEGARDPQFARGWLERVADAGQAFWFYLGKLAWPHPLVFIYPRFAPDTASAWAYLAFIAMAALLAALAWRRAGPLRPAALAFGFFTIALLPVLGFFDQYFWRYSLVGDHFQYLASIGPLALGAAGLAVAHRRLGGAARAAVSLAAGAWVLGLAAVTLAHEPAFASSDRLWQESLAVNPRCWMAYTNLGTSHLGHGRPDEARACFEKAIEVRPEDVAAHIDLGDALLQLGRPAEALQAYVRASDLDPGEARALNGMGDALNRMGRPDRAEEPLRRAIALKRPFADARVNLGNALSAQGRPEEAMREFRAAVLEDAGNAQAHANVGALLLQSGQVTEGEVELHRALELDPALAPALANLGSSLLARGDRRGARPLLEKALSINPTLGTVHAALAGLLLDDGATDEALAHARKAVALEPRMGAAHRVLARALFAKGLIEESESESDTALRLDGR